MENADKQLKEFIKMMKGKKKKKKKENNAYSIFTNMTRKELNDYNENREQSERIMLPPSIDVGDIIKYCRKLNRVKRLKYLNEPDLTSTISDDPEPTKNSAEDTTIPEMDTPLMESKQNQNDQGLNQKISIKSPLGNIQEAPLKATESPQIQACPEKVVDIVEISDLITFDDLFTDDENSDAEHSYPTWTKDRVVLAEIQERNALIMAPLIETFFCQPYKESIASQFFPNTYKMIKRRRSSTTWE